MVVIFSKIPAIGIDAVLQSLKLQCDTWVTKISITRYIGTLTSVIVCT
jgi:hypothetical protein